MCYKQYAIRTCIIIFGTFLEHIFSLAFYPFCFVLWNYIYVYVFLCIVICMHSFHSGHIFIVQSNVICTKLVTILFYNGYIVIFIANYIKGRKTYITYKNNTSSQRQFKTSVPQS